VISAVVWINEGTWEACIDEAKRLLPSEARITLLHVSSGEVEELAGERRWLLGRHPPPPPGPPVRTIAAEEAEALLGAARVRLGREAVLSARRGRIERELLAACEEADLLLLSREPGHRKGPKSIPPPARFVIDHAPCQVLLVHATGSES
jgi:nucleotide-binding universal stress UspA family protein